MGSPLSVQLATVSSVVQATLTSSPRNAVVGVTLKVPASGMTVTLTDSVALQYTPYSISPTRVGITVTWSDCTYLFVYTPSS